MLEAVQQSMSNQIKNRSKDRMKMLIKIQDLYEEFTCEYPVILVVNGYTQEIQNPSANNCFSIAEQTNQIIPSITTCFSESTI